MASGEADGGTLHSLLLCGVGRAIARGEKEVSCGEGDDASEAFYLREDDLRVSNWRSYWGGGPMGRIWWN